ncbi:hypothetical protein [Flavobacterium pedocola]
MKKKLCLLVISITSFFFIGCATKFHQSYKNPTKFDKQSISRINGEYSIYPIDSTGSFSDNEFNNEFNNAFIKFYRKYGRVVRDTLKLSKLHDYSLKLEIKNEAEIELKYLKNKNIIKQLKLPYEIKPDGYLYLENKNRLYQGIPYLFGGVDIKKIRLGMDPAENLIIEEVYHSSGALLFIFGDSKTWHNRNYYKKIKP